MQLPALHACARCAGTKRWRNNELIRLPDVPDALACLLLVPLRAHLSGETMHYTHYDYLEIAPGATRAAIDAAYAQRLEQFGHGTRIGGTDHSALLAQIHKAYEVLADPVARKAYDAQLAQEAALADAELKAALDSIAARAHRALRTDTLTAGSAVLV
jgi:hypothetical protein